MTDRLFDWLSSQHPPAPAPRPPVAASRRLALAAMLAVTAMSGCAGHAPNLTAISQSTDDALGCEQIRTEIAANNEELVRLASAKGWKTAQNVALGAAGFLVPVLWLGMDVQGTASRETTSVEQRNAMLGALARKEGC